MTPTAYAYYDKENRKNHAQGGRLCPEPSTRRRVAARHRSTIRSAPARRCCWMLRRTKASAEQFRPLSARAASFRLSRWLNEITARRRCARVDQRRRSYDRHADLLLLTALAATPPCSASDGQSTKRNGVPRNSPLEPRRRQRARDDRPRQPDADRAALRRHARSAISTSRLRWRFCPTGGCW